MINLSPDRVLVGSSRKFSLEKIKIECNWLNYSLLASPFLREIGNKALSVEYSKYKQKRNIAHQNVYRKLYKYSVCSSVSHILYKKINWLRRFYIVHHNVAPVTFCNVHFVILYCAFSFYYIYFFIFMRSMYMYICIK